MLRAQCLDARMTLGATQMTKRRLLLVDDDATLRRAIARMLEASFDVAHANDGEEAVALVLAGERFDFVVMDLEMPRLDGRRALARIEELAPDLARRTLIMTGGSNVLELQQWISSLGTRLLLKPFSRRRFEEAIDDLPVD